MEKQKIPKTHGVVLGICERKAGLEPAGADAPARGYIYIPPKSPFEKGGLRGSRVL